MQPHLKSINPFTDYFVPLVGNLSITCLFSYRANDPSTARDCNRSVFSENPRIQFVTISQRSRTNTGLHGQPQGIHPPRRIRHILIIIQPTRKTNRIRRNESAGIGRSEERRVGKEGRVGWLWYE